MKCVVPLCPGKGNFHFPSDKEMCRKWVLAIGRPSYEPKSWHSLCPAHFKTEDFLEEGFYSGVKLMRRRLKPGTIPTIFPGNQTDVHVRAPEAHAPVKPPLKKMKKIACCDEPQCISVIMETEEEDDPLALPDSSSAPHSPLSSSEDQEIPFVTCSDPGVHAKVVTGNAVSGVTKVGYTTNEKVSTSTQTPRSVLVSIDNFMNRPDVIAYYTGFECYEKFMTVFSSLRPDDSLQYGCSNVCSISLPDQLFMTIWKLRLNTPDFELGVYFKLSEFQVSSVFCTWIQFMAQQWSEIDTWPTRELVDFYLPRLLGNNCLKTRVIINGTEGQISKARNPQIQQYRNNTQKTAVGTSPSESTTCHSPAPANSASDKQVIEHSDLLNKCDRPNSVMADRDFSVRDLAAEDIRVNNSDSNSPGSTVESDGKFEKQRVHFERSIGLMKTYRILKTDFNHYQLPMGMKIISVIYMLCNFRADRKMLD